MIGDILLRIQGIRNSVFVGKRRLYHFSTSLFRKIAEKRFIMTFMLCCDLFVFLLEHRIVCALRIFGIFVDEISLKIELVLNGPQLFGCDNRHFAVSLIYDSDFFVRHYFALRIFFYLEQIFEACVNFSSIPAEIQRKAVKRKVEENFLFFT